MTHSSNVKMALALSASAVVSAVTCGPCSGCLWEYAPGQTACYATWDKATCNRYSANGYSWCGGGEGGEDTTTPAPVTAAPTTAPPTTAPPTTAPPTTAPPTSDQEGPANPECGSCNGCWWTAVGSNIGCYSTWTQAMCDGYGDAYVWCAGGGGGGGTSPTAAPVSPTAAPVSPTAAPVSPTAAPVSPTPAPVSPTPGPVGPTDPTSKKFVMYYPAWATYQKNKQVADIDPTKLTHINYGFVNIANGECVLGDPYADVQKTFPGDTWADAEAEKAGNIGQLQKLRQRNPNLVLMASIGGWTWSGGFADVARTEASRAKFADSCSKLMLKYGFDGLDVDWEFPVIGGLDSNKKGPEDKENFTLLLRAMRQSMDSLGTGVHHPLTIASAPNPNNINLSYDIPAINDVLDFINLMSYDYNGAWTSETGHNAPLFANPGAAEPGFNVANAVEKYLEAGVSKDKLILGLAFYGRGWANVQSNTDGLFKPASGPSQGTMEKGVLDYYDLAENYVNKNGFTRHWDDVSKVPYLFNPSTKVFITYDDEESMCWKSKYAVLEGLGGGMVWEVTGDYQRRLQNLAYDVIVKGETANC